MNSHDAWYAASAVELDDRAPGLRLVAELRREDLLDMAERSDPTARPRPETATDFIALLKISEALSSIRGLSELHQPVLELVREAIAFDRGAVLLLGRTSTEFESMFGVGSSAETDGRIRISRSLAKRVLGEGVSIMSATDGDAEARSGGIGSALTAPLMVFDRVLGLIHLERDHSTTCFEKGHLQWLTVIAGIAAMALDNARHVERLENENECLRADTDVEHDMVGSAPRMREICQFIARVSRADSTVLIRGESGTGKELVARAVHRNSPRAAAPLVAINCAALTESLLESELFGHEKGAFTGAVTQKKGKLEVADRGSLFLDEIAELPMALQPKLLRVLQERAFDRVGGTRPVHVDIRLIAATNRDMEQEVEAGRFRLDLYYRLNVVSITVPPLRERREDIPALATHFAARHSRKTKRRVTGISAAATAWLTNYDWPGNVRELENVIERAVVLGSTELILPEDLSEAVLERRPPAGVPAATYHEAIADLKKELIVKAVEHSRGNYTEAAKALAVHPNYLHRLIRNLELKPVLLKLR